MDGPSALVRHSTPLSLSEFQILDTIPLLIDVRQVATTGVQRDAGLRAGGENETGVRKAWLLLRQSHLW